MRPLRAATLLLLVTLAQPTFTASAQTQAESVAAARSLGIQGVHLADQGKCAEAADKLARAEALYHAPTILGRLGECQVELGQVVLGTENLNRVVREPLAANAPQAFRDAQERARRVLERALPRIAYLTVHVQPSGLAPSLSVAGTQVPTALIGAERPTDPGTHEVVATAPGHLPAKTTVTLAEGARQEVTLTLAPDPTAAPASGAPAPIAAAPLTTTPVVAAAAPRQNHTLAYVLLGVGGAGLITGGVTGVLAMGKESDLDCPENACPPDQHDALSSARTLALVSTVGFGVGLAGVAAGTVLLLTGSSEPEARVGVLRARPYVGADRVGLFGTF